MGLKADKGTMGMEKECALLNLIREHVGSFNAATCLAVLEAAEESKWTSRKNPFIPIPIPIPILIAIAISISRF